MPDSNEPTPLGFAGPADKIVLKRLAVPIAELAVFIVALGIVSMARVFAQMALDFVHYVLRRIPFAGRLVGSVTEKLLNIVVGQLGALERRLDNRIAGYFHDVAAGVVDLAAFVAAVGVTFAYVGWAIVTRIHPAWGPKAYPEFVRTQTTVKTRLVRLTHRVTDLERRFSKLIHGKLGVAVHTIVRPVETRVKTVEQTTVRITKTIRLTVTKALPRQFVRLQRDVRKLERGEIQLRTRVHKLEKRTLGLGLTAAVAGALARLGLNWLRCRNVRRLGRGVCNMDTGLLSFLLGDILEALIVADLCDFVAAMSVAAEAFEPVLIAFVDVEDALIGCHGITKPPALPLRVAALPSSNAGMPLAA